MIDERGPTLLLRNVLVNELGEKPMGDFLSPCFVEIRENDGRAFGREHRLPPDRTQPR